MPNSNEKHPQPKFNERLKTFDRIAWRLGAPSLGHLHLVLPRTVTVEGRPCGLVDGVTGAMLVQGMESTRLLCALRDHLGALGHAMKSGSTEQVAAWLLDLPGVVDTLDQHIDPTFDAVELARNAHDAAEAVERFKQSGGRTN